MSAAISIALLAAAPDQNGRQWIQLLPAGTFTGQDGRGPFDTGDLSALAARSLSQGRKLPIDVNHAIDLKTSKGDDSPAVGWIVELQARETGLWGLAEWTEEGRKLVSGKAYGFISPVLMHTKDKPYRVNRILRASLVNDPNITTMVALHAAGKGFSMTHDEFMTELRKALGLDELADETAVLAKIGEAKSAHGVDPARFVPIDVFEKTAAELRRVNSGVTLQEAERVVDGAIAQMALLPFMRDWAISLCTANRPAFDAYVERMGKPLQSMFSPSGLNRRYREDIERAGAGDADEVARKLGLSGEDMAKYAPKDTY